MEELFKATVLEGPEHSRANPLACQTLQDLEFSLAVDEVLDLWAVNSEEQFTVADVSW